MNVTLTTRGLIAIQGRGNTEFLQSILTQAMLTEIPSDSLRSALLLNANGHLVYDCLAWRDPSTETWFLDVERACCADWILRLNRYRLHGTFTIVDVSEHWAVFASLNPMESCVCYQDPRHDHLGYRGYQFLNKPSILPHPSDPIARYHAHRIHLGIPEGIHDLEPNCFPLQARLHTTHSLSWNKGCYIGQEAIAHMRRHGVIRKMLWPFESNAWIAERSEIVRDGTRVGIVQSVYQTDQGVLGFAWICVNPTSDEHPSHAKTQSEVQLRFLPLEPVRV
jgi:folate-binding protein YgfZ